MAKLHSVFATHIEECTHRAQTLSETAEFSACDSGGPQQIEEYLIAVIRSSWTCVEAGLERIRNKDFEYIEVADFKACRKR